jgi:hypothetical protein
MVYVVRSYLVDFDLFLGIIDIECESQKDTNAISTNSTPRSDENIVPIVTAIGHHSSGKGNDVKRSKKSIIRKHCKEVGLIFCLFCFSLLLLNTNCFTIFRKLKELFRDNECSITHPSTKYDIHVWLHKIAV